MSQVSVMRWIRLGGFYVLYYALIGAFLPFWSLYLELSGFSKAQIGILLAIPMLARIVAPSLWGYLSDKTGLKVSWIRMATLAEMLACASLLVLPKEFWPYALMLVWFGFFQNAVVPILESVTLGWLGEKREHYSKIRLWGSLGFIGSVTFFGLWVENHGVDDLPVLLVALTFSSFALSLFIKDPPQPHVAEPRLASTEFDHANQAQTAQGLGALTFKNVFYQRPVCWFYLSQLILLFSHAPFYSFFSILLHEAGYSAAQIGVLWSLGVVSEIVMFSLGRPLLKFGTYPLVLMVMLITGVRWIITGALTEFIWALVFAQILHAFSFGLFQMLSMHFISSQLPAQFQGRAQAAYASCWGAGVAAGSIVVGLLWNRTGGSFWFIICGVLLLIYALWMGLVGSGIFTSNTQAISGDREER